MEHHGTAFTIKKTSTLRTEWFSSFMKRALSKRQSLGMFKQNLWAQVSYSWEFL